MMIQLNRHRHGRGKAAIYLTIALFVAVSGQAASQSRAGSGGSRFSHGRIHSVVEEGRMLPGAIDAFARPLFGGSRAPSARYAVDVAVLRIYTRYPSGALTQTRVQVFVPDTAAPEAVYLFAPGSTGLIGICRPSREHEAGIVWGRYRAHVLAVAAQGFIGVLPDYIGFEDAEGIQPYFHAESEARVLFNALYAVDQWVRTQLPDGIESLTRVAAGYSQGGHAAFAAADRNELLGGALALDGVIGYGPTTEIEPLFRTYPSLAPMVVMSFASIYGRDRVDPHAILLDRWADELEYDTTRQCVGGIQRFYPSSPAGLFDPTFLASLQADRLDQTHPSIAAVFAANRTGLGGQRLPVLILQGTDDVVVRRSVQDRFVSNLRRQGTPVEYIVYDGVRHDTRQIAFSDVIAWIRALE